MFTEEQYDQMVDHETVRLMNLQVDKDEAMRIIKHYHTNGITGLKDNVTIDACQRILKLYNTPVPAL